MVAAFAAGFPSVSSGVTAATLAKPKVERSGEGSSSGMEGTVQGLGHLLKRLPKQRLNIHPSGNAIHCILREIFAWQVALH
jgi:hypothetical protein